MYHFPAGLASSYTQTTGGSGLPPNPGCAGQACAGCWGGGPSTTGLGAVKSQEKC